LGKATGGGDGPMSKERGLTVGNGGLERRRKVEERLRG